MIRRKHGKRTRRGDKPKKNQRTDQSSIDQNPQNETRKKFWINPQGQTVHWNSRANCYKRRPRRYDKSATAAADSMTPEMQKEIDSLLAEDMHRDRFMEGKSRLRQSFTATDKKKKKEKHNLFNAKSRLRRTFSSKRQGMSQRTDSTKNSISY